MALNNWENGKFWEDNVPTHVLRATKHWINDHNIDTIQWPPRSPDLNPNKSLWGLPARRVYNSGRQFAFTEVLKQAANMEWARNDNSVIQNLLLPVRMRFVKVDKSNGGK